MSDDDDCGDDNGCFYYDDAEYHERAHTRVVVVVNVCPGTRMLVVVS